MEKKVSVIVPIYNAEIHIEKCVHSLLAQKYSNIEIVLVDDGSTDRSSPLCDSLKDQYPNITVLHKENGGVSSARNAGLMIATGDYIGFADCDDTLKPDMYQTLVDVMDRSDMALGAYEKVHQAANAVVHLPFAGILQGENIIKVAYSMAFWNGYFKGTYLQTMYGSVWPNLYSADIIRKYHLSFPEDISIGEDLIFNLAYLKHTKSICCIDIPLYEYSVGNSSATRKKNTRLWEQYCLLLNREKNILLSEDTDEKELLYNFYRQHICFAIGVIEEQIAPFYTGADINRQIRMLCKSTELKVASRYILLHGHSIKDRLQAFLFYCKFDTLLKWWLLR